MLFTQLFCVQYIQTFALQKDTIYVPRFRYYCNDEFNYLNYVFVYWNETQRVIEYSRGGTMHAVLKIRSSRWIQIYYAPKRLLNNIWAREINVFLYASQSWRNRMKFNGTMCPVSFQNLQDITKIFRTSNKLHKRHILHVWDILFNKISLLSFNFINSWVFLCVIFFTFFFSVFFSC